ncbi:MAG TPA: DUF1080 domain-containing protein [Bryobacteraceae bacterium]|nr:DUF1080 domain-containing protein [Bryobacteraceae bacterium]
MRKSLFLILALTLPLAAQRRPQVNDGEMHGDPHYLIEEGWKPLLNGKDLTGWKSASSGNNEWLTTNGIHWERLLGPTRLNPIQGATPGGGTILNSRSGRTVNLMTEEKFGDMELYLEFMIAKGSNSGVYLHGLYEVQIFDSWNSDHPMTTSDGGAIYHKWINEQGVGGSAPSQNASRPPGQWQSYYILFQAPKFDAAGKKTANAKFLRVVHNGVIVQKDVEVDGPTRAAMNIPEAATNPVMLQGDHGPVAYKNIYWRPLRPIVVR